MLLLSFALAAEKTNSVVNTGLILEGVGMGSTTLGTIALVSSINGRGNALDQVVGFFFGSLLLVPGSVMMEAGAPVFLTGVGSEIGPNEPRTLQNVAWGLYGGHLALVTGGLLGLRATHGDGELFTIPILAGGLMLPASFAVSAFQLRQSRNSSAGLTVPLIYVPLASGHW